MKKIVLRTAILWCAILFLSCSKNSSGTSTTTTNPPPGNTSDKISIANMAFVSSSTTVAKGTTVTWTNNDDMAHTVTADDNSFTSGNLSKGDTYSHTFSNVATVTYHCNIHPAMTGSVTVK